MTQDIDPIEKDYVPEWFEDVDTCAHCGGVLETEDWIVLAGWFGTNHDEGVERKVRCTDCDHPGQLQAFDDGRTSRLGSAAPQMADTDLP